LIHLRLIEKSEDYAVTVYWTRGQVGVKNKASARQLWCTTNKCLLKFSDKILLANAVVSWLEFFAPFGF